MNSAEGDLRGGGPPIDSATKIWSDTIHILQSLLGVWCYSCILPLLFDGMKLYPDLFEFVLVSHSLVSCNSHVAPAGSIYLLQQWSERISVMFFLDADCSLSIYHLHFCHVGCASLSSILVLEKFDKRSIWLLEVVLTFELFDVICVMCSLVYVKWPEGPYIVFSFVYQK